MGYAPIVMFVYDRADHFRASFDALSVCPEAAESDLYIFSDGPKNEKAEAGVNEVRRFADGVKSSGKFRSVTVTESEKNKGLAASVISGVTEVINKFGRVIVVEDDSVASPHFLKYMNACLDKFADDPEIGAIAGYSPPIMMPAGYDKDVFFAYRSCSCAWATWKRSWEGVDWSLETIGDLYRDGELLKRLNSNGADRFIRLYRQSKSDRGSWSVRFGYHLVKNGLLTVYPKYSYIDNIGGDGTGVHSKESDPGLRADLSLAVPDPVLEKPELNGEIQKRMKKFYSGGLVSDIKRAAATRWIILKERRKLK